ncbi:LOW QUALITY PROTEIN: uncharacterized protein LOC127725210 [Mytilus californianus]|uniref:LOW QUALITY PROTEIN: uncharacterized protein LOC127725210 n=1 Tax=Mytilus californianus TaxID=6549 RepID=UPI002246D652|nr:LOW QUALITY PROTEIN: uncharacterized protein LOC127725210 [Mytilus californianus]
MGNSQTCVDCKTEVPKKVKWLDKIHDDWGRRLSKWKNNEIWIKLGSDKYLCSPCLIKRQNQERQKLQEEQQRQENEKRKQDENQREAENQQKEMHRRKEMQQKLRKEAERRQREEAERRQREEALRRQREEAERRQREEAERRQREKAECKRREEAERRQREEAERRQREEAELRRREKAERRQREEAERRQRVETERRQREEAERRQKEETERRQREEAELRKRDEAERRQREEAKRRQREEEECKRREEAERRQRENAERRQREEEKRKQREEAERRQREKEERIKMEETERRQREEAERKQREEAERSQREEAECRQMKEAESRQREKSERRQREEAERRKREEAECRQREKAERRQREEAERKRREEAESKQREEAERKQREETERRQREEAERKHREETERRQRDEAKLRQREEAEHRQREKAERRQRKETERKQVEEAERRQREETERRRREEAECVEKAKEFLLYEERFSDWQRRENGAKNEVEYSQILQRFPPKSIISNIKKLSTSKDISNSKKEPQIDNPQQKDDRCVVQELIDTGHINEDASATISNVLLAVQKKIQNYENQNRYHRMRQSPDHRSVRRFCSQRSNFADNEKQFSDCIFEICLAVKLTKSYWPRNTQITSLCLLVRAIQKGILLEINTGEGKTCIIAMFSAFLASCEINIDIVSSSPILAQRDFIEWKEFYKSLKVSVSCNLIPKKTVERLKCYSHTVVYGTVASFASDLLRQTFLMDNVRGERRCEAVIVDEVDCMLLDQGVHFTYLSHAVPGMHHIEPILFMIWKHIIKHERIVSEKSEHFFLGVLDSLPIVLSSYIDLSEFYMETDIPPEIQWLYLFKQKNLFNADFSTYLLKGNTSELQDIFTIEKILECLEFVEEEFNLPIKFQPYTIVNETTVRAVQWGHSSHATKEQIIHVLVVGKGLVCVLHPYEDEKEIHNFIKDEVKNYISFDGCKPDKHHIPAYLEEYVQNRLISWIENAFTAKHMLNGREYLVKDNDVVPVDFESTGVVQLDTKWGDCLHQFLEIKHGKKLSQITLVTNFMSNQEYFRRYKGKIFGVSGTLGTEREKSFLRKQFSLGCQKIPTHRSKVFEELSGIICNSKQEWIIEIQTVVRDQVTKTKNKMQRAVLVICEDINTAKELQENLNHTDCASAALYTRNDENNDKIDSKLKAGDIIVATNIAGRGTDIDIDDSVEKAGGLFVLVTFHHKIHELKINFLAEVQGKVNRVADK